MENCKEMKSVGDTQARRVWDGDDGLLAPNG